MFGCLWICLGISILIVFLIIIAFVIKLIYYFSDYSLYFVLERLKYWSIFSLEIIATFVGFIILIRMLYDLAKDILILKENNRHQKDISIIKQNLNKIMQNIILNLVVLSSFYYLYCRFESEYYKTVMILYTSVILGFTASFPLLKDTYLISTNTETLLIFKTFGNSSMLFGSYLFYNFYLKYKF